MRRLLRPLCWLEMSWPRLSPWGWAVISGHRLVETEHTPQRQVLTCTRCRFESVGWYAT